MNFGKSSTLPETRRGGDAQTQLEFLIRFLGNLPEAEIIEFDRIFRRLWIDAYTRPLWDAAILAGRGCSDDGFMDLRGWLICRGKKAYENALADPDSLADILDKGECGQEVEGFVGAAAQAWQRRTGRDPAEFPTAGLEHPSEPAGKSRGRRRRR